VQVVDFGLAKVVRRKYSNSSEAYQMTSHTGSLRYMAPEVGMARPYNEKVRDLYQHRYTWMYVYKGIAG
jgi:serine/threonine protein kinase